MKKSKILVITMMSVILLLGSCDMNQFDFSELDTVIASGQWKLPVGSFDVSLERVLDQVAENDLVVPDADGNLQISYRFSMDPIVTGSDFMKIKDFESPVATSVPIEDPNSNVVHVEQMVSLESEELQLVSATIRSGKFIFMVENTLGQINKVLVKSPNIMNPDHTPFVREMVLDGITPVDMAGVFLDADSVNTIQIIYEIYYESDIEIPALYFSGRVKVEDLCIKEMSGYINSYAIPFRLDTTFTQPFDNVQGDITFADARLDVMERNSFNVSALLRIDTAMLYGENAAPSYLFNSYPVELDVHYSPEYTSFFNDNMNLEISSKFDKIKAAGEIIFNPEGHNSLITITDESSMGLDAEALLPIKFNIPEVTYNDTVDLDFSEVTVPDLVKEVLLHIDIASELPFNFSGQLFTIDPETGLPSDSLFANPKPIRGSFDREPVKTQITASVTKQLLANLMMSRKLLMRFRADTEDHDVTLNLDDKIQVTMKADIIYDGEINTSDFSND